GSALRQAVVRGGHEGDAIAGRRPGGPRARAPENRHAPEEVRRVLRHEAGVRLEDDSPDVAGGSVGLLETVHEGAAGERDAARRRRDLRGSWYPPRRHREIELDGVPGPQGRST